VNSSDPETATFVLHKATKIKMLLVFTRKPSYPREDALQM